MKKIFCSVLFFSAFLNFASAVSNAGLTYPRKVVNGKVYYEYTVQKSEGFYSICKKFKVTEEEIKAVNPGLENGPTYDTTILIPYKDEQYTPHRVDRKETLYSISKKYNVSVKDLYDMNPELEREGLKSGMEIRIPTTRTASAQTMTVSDSVTKITKTAQPTFSVHEVVKGETLFSISRLYGISTEEIVRLNPDVKDGVKIGKKLIIPPVHSQTTLSSNSVAGKNTQFTTHVVQKKETLYSISKTYGITHDEIVKLNPNVNDGLKEGMILILPPSFAASTDSLSTSNEDIPVVALDSVLDVKDLFTRSYIPKKEVSAAIVLPFQLSKVATNSKIDINTRRFLEFYQGFLLAVDSLKQNGLSFNIYTFDSGKTEEDIQKIVDRTELKSMDYIIGPAYISQNKKLSDFALENNIKLVIPFSSKAEETNTNPNIFQINAPVEKSNYIMADLFIKEFKDKNIVLWRFKNAAYDDKKQFADTLAFMLKERGIAFKTVMFDNIATIRAAITTEKENVVIPLTTNQVALSQALPMVNMLQTDKKSVSVFGFSEWQNYQSISKDMYVLTTYFVTPYHVDFSNPEVRSYLSKFRHFYNGEPFNGQPQYGMVGYDLGMYFSSAIAQNGHDFEFSGKDVKVNTLQSKFYFDRVAEKGGFYSKGMFIVRHDGQTGTVATDGVTMQVCPICAENLQKIENQQKIKK